MKGVKLIDKQEQMLEMVRQYHKEGKNIRIFCQEHSMCLSTFRYWVMKYNRFIETQPTPSVNDSFIPLHVTGEPDEMDGKLEILYPNGVGMRVPMRTDANLLKTLVTIF